MQVFFVDKRGNDLECPSHQIAKDVFLLQARALTVIASRVAADFDAAIDLIIANQGRVIVSGMGKSGIVGKKIAATLASTGTPSFFVHPAESYHGDLGMITSSDITLLISYSGETEEVIRLIPTLKRLGVLIIAFVGNANSTLGRYADVALDISVERESCPHNLAPTTSTTTTLAMGDAVAITLMRRRNFLPADFAVFHPGGSLGKKLLTRVRDVMHAENLPFNTPRDSFRQVIAQIMRGRLGLSLITQDGNLVGIITDGDLRRAIDSTKDPMTLTAEEMMTSSPITIHPDMMFVEAEERMRHEKITSLIVAGDDGGILGILQIYDL